LDAQTGNHDVNAHGRRVHVVRSSGDQTTGKLEYQGDNVARNELVEC
jgi:hypothetical protein